MAVEGKLQQNEPDSDNDDFDEWSSTSQLTSPSSLSSEEEEEQPTLTAGRSVWWPDERGRRPEDCEQDSSSCLLPPLETVHEIVYAPPAMVRVVILLLNPDRKKFEFIHCEIDTEERLPVKAVLEQLPSLATNRSLQRKRYGSLCRNGMELLNTMAITEYGLRDGEILLAVPRKRSPKAAMAAATQLLSDRAMVRGIRKAVLSGRALQKLTLKEEEEETKSKDDSFDEDASEESVVFNNFVLLNTAEQEEKVDGVMFGKEVGGDDDNSVDSRDSVMNSKRVQIPEFISMFRFADNQKQYRISL